jgi:UDP-GlcNAc:undecaprenyl-phosphate/decaprenyl-phosphate GlcNAc-1-phosphate transferase
MKYNWILTGLIIFASTAIFSFVLSRLLLKSRLCTYFCDLPGKRKVHQRVIPRIGGISIIISFLVILTCCKLFFSDFIPQIDLSVFNTVVFATICIGIIGFVDDINFLYINVRARFLLELLIAFEIAFFYGIHFTSITIMDKTVNFGLLSIPVSMLYMVGITNAANIIDGIDGLASGVLIIGFLSIAIMAANIGQFAIVIICLIIAGAISGFFPNNKAPARAFLGDSGSLFLGLLLSLLAIHVTNQPGSHSSIIVALLIAGFPIVDVSAAMIRRFIKSLIAGYPIVRSLRNMGVADSEHIHHRLLYRGLGHSQASLVLYIFSSTFCIAAILISRIPVKYGLIALCYLTFVIIAVLYQLNFFDRITKLIKPKTAKHGEHDNRITIGVIQADPILRYALDIYKQKMFNFEFLPAGIALSEPQNYSVMIYACGANSSQDLKNAKKISQVQKCSLLFISDIPNNKKLHKETSVISEITYVNKPIYIPVLMENIYDLVKLKHLRTITQEPKIAT